MTLYANDLRNQLRETEDPPACLLIAVLILLVDKAKIAVHASGKFVSPLSKYLATNVESLPERISPDTLELVNETQKLVVQMFKSKGGKETETVAVQENIEKLKGVLLTS